MKGRRKGEKCCRVNNVKGVGKNENAKTQQRTVNGSMDNPKIIQYFSRTFCAYCTCIDVEIPFMKSKVPIDVFNFCVYTDYGPCTFLNCKVLLVVVFMLRMGFLSLAVEPRGSWQSV